MRTLRSVLGSHTQCSCNDNRPNLTDAGQPEHAGVGDLLGAVAKHQGGAHRKRGHVHQLLVEQRVRALFAQHAAGLGGSAGRRVSGCNRSSGSSGSCRVVPSSERAGHRTKPTCERSCQRWEPRGCAMSASCTPYCANVRARCSREPGAAACANVRQSWRLMVLPCAEPWAPFSDVSTTTTCLCEEEGPVGGTKCFGSVLRGRQQGARHACAARQAGPHRRPGSGAPRAAPAG